MDLTEDRENPEQSAIDRDTPERDGHLDFLHRISGRLATADPLHEVLDQIVDFLNDVVGADSCFIYVLEGKELVLRASKNPHPESVDQLRIPVGEGITGWVAQKREAVAIARGAMRDARFFSFGQLPEDRFEAFLSVPILAGGPACRSLEPSAPASLTSTRRRKASWSRRSDIWLAPKSSGLDWIPRSQS